MRIGVFVCHCGSNIAGTVDCVKVAEAAKDFPNVAYSEDTMYACSEPGQDSIIEAIEKYQLTGRNRLEIIEKTKEIFLEYYPLPEVSLKMIDLK